jgi:hypothetical protein
MRILLLVLMSGLVSGLADGLAEGFECEEPLHKHYCVMKGHVAKELPPHDPPLAVFMDLGVSVTAVLQFYSTLKCGLLSPLWSCVTKKVR